MTNQLPIIAEFTAKRYEPGDEDGFRLYYSYARCDENLTPEPFKTFENIEDLNTWKWEIINNQKGDNCILFKEPVPVLNTVEGLEDIMSYHYIIRNSSSEACLIHERVLSMFRYNHDLENSKTINGTIHLSK